MGPERARLTEIDRACLNEGYGVTTAAIIGVHEPDAVTQLAPHHGWMPDVLNDRRLI